MTYASAFLSGLFVSDCRLGWITVFGWQATVTSICFLVGAQIQGMLILNYPDYTPQRWQGTLLMWAVMIFAYVVNVYAVKILPALQMVGGIMHVTFFIVLIIPLILLAHRSPPEFVFKTLLNEGGWQSDGVSWCLGMLTVTYCFLGKNCPQSTVDPFRRWCPQFQLTDSYRLRRRHPHE